MTKIDQILLDLDDVCNHFTMHALEFVSGKVLFEDQFPASVGYDIVAAYNILTKYKDPLTPDEFWAKVTPDIWYTMPRRQDTDWLLTLCAEAVGRENVLICTKSLGDPQHFAGKVQWMYDNLPDWILGQFSITPLKEAYARPSTLLIDDCDVNVDKFRHTKGGRGLLVPRPWNRLMWTNPHKHILEEFDVLFKPQKLQESLGTEGTFGVV